MNRIVLVIVAMLMSMGVMSAQCKLDVEVVNIENSKGVIRIGVYNQEDGCFDASKSFKGDVQDAQKGVMHFSFDLPKGKYVVAVIHDENGNGILDKNFLGIPREGYGFSGIATRPVYKDALFELHSSQKIQIKMR